MGIKEHKITELFVQPSPSSLAGVWEVLGGKGFHLFVPVRVREMVHSVTQINITCPSQQRERFTGVESCRGCRRY